MKRSLVSFAAAAAIALGALLVTPSVPRAQSVPQPTSGQRDHTPAIAPDPGALTVLYDQTTSPGTGDITSQDFETAYDQYDDQAADDFVVPAGQLWSIQQVFVDGEYNVGGTAAAVHVFFYTDTATLPGTVQCSYTSVPITTDAAGDFTINLPAPCVLGAGTHWISVQTREDFNPNGQWFWKNRTPLVGSGAAWRNPGGGFGLGCPNWGRRATCATSTDPDQIFKLSGVILPAQCGAWQVKTPFPAPDVYGASAASSGNYVYLAGGYSFSLAADTNAFRRYDLAANTWTTLAVLPDSSATMASAVYSPVNNKVYVFGGESVVSGVVTNATRIYDVAGNTWSAGVNMPDVRAFMASGYSNGKIYLVAGYNTYTIDSAQAQVWEYNPVANTWNTSRLNIPHAVGGPGFGIINGHVYVAGGRDATDVLVTNVYDYNIAANTWTQRADLPAGNNIPGSAAVGGQLWLFGGGNPFGPSATPQADDPPTSAATRMFDPTSNTWSNGPALAGVRSFVAGAAAGNTIFAAGGYNGSTTVTTTETSRCAGRMDFDTDGKTDRTVFRPSTGVWYSALSNGGATATHWGTTGDIDVVGDYDGDGIPDLAVFRPSSGTWYIVWSSTNTVHVAVWGTSGDIPMAADVDGDGNDDLVIWRPSTGVWYVKNSSGGVTAFGWGTSGDLPLVGDFDGDGKADMTIYRPSTGVWYISYSGGGWASLGWGTSGDIPVIGDFDGDGKSDPTVFRPSSGQWFVNKSTGGYTSVVWGTSGDMPISGDWDGDGRSDFTVWRDSSGVWYTKYAAGGVVGVGFGTSGDKPTGRRPGS